MVSLVFCFGFAFCKKEDGEEYDFEICFEFFFLRRSFSFHVRFHSLSDFGMDEEKAVHARCMWIQVLSNIEFLKFVYRKSKIFKKNDFFRKENSC